MVFHVRHKLSFQVTCESTLVACESRWGFQWPACNAVTHTHVSIQLRLGIAYSRAMRTSVALVPPEVAQVLLPEAFLTLDYMCLLFLLGDVAVPEFIVSCKITGRWADNSAVRTLLFPFNGRPF